MSTAAAMAVEMVVAATAAMAVSGDGCVDGNADIKTVSKGTIWIGSKTAFFSI